MGPKLGMSRLALPIFYRESVDLDGGSRLGVGEPSDRADIRLKVPGKTILTCARALFPK